MNRTEKFSDVRAIADDICAGRATQVQLQQLEKLLSKDEQAQQFYLGKTVEPAHLITSNFTFI